MRLSPEHLLARLASDKKTLQGKVHFVLPVADWRSEGSLREWIRIECDRLLSIRLKENRECSRGTTPPGTSSEQQAAQWVQQMFAEIAPQYDLLNHYSRSTLTAAGARHY